MLSNAPSTPRTGWRTRITAFAGSMMFVYIHVLWFGCWIGFGLEKYPFGLLTMIVSLEAIFLSTFVLISQNRADAKRQVIADQQWETVQEEDHQNRQLLELSEQILALTKEVRGFAGFAAEDHEQNEELLALSRRTLVLAEEAHKSAGAARPGSGGLQRSSGHDPKTTRNDAYRRATAELPAGLDVYPPMRPISRT
jgi:uncharacterized membrane protein